MSIVGAYDLYLYCDHPAHDIDLHGCNPAIYSGATRGVAVRRARQGGWLISPTRRAPPESWSPGSRLSLCPLHSGKRPDLTARAS